MQGVPHYTQGISKSVVQQTVPQYCLYLQVIEQTLRHPLYQGPKVQAILNKPVEH